MDKFTTLTGVAAPMPIVNVDTDMIIPKDYLKTIKRTGLGSGLFAEMRYRDNGSENPDFVLNKPAYRKAQILVAGDNFGCGSSREHAPWALLDFGIRCVISTSFADIFYNNCFKNGILPVTVSPEDLDKLLDDAGRGSNATVTVDLEAQEIRGPDGGTVNFEIDAFRRHCLLNGLDDIGLTLEKATAIDAFERHNAESRPLGMIPPGGAEHLAIRRLISTGSPFETAAGYSRAVVNGDWCFVSGTTGYDYATMTMPDSVEAQARNCLATIIQTLTTAGFAMTDVVRAHYYVSERADIDAVFPIVGEAFGKIRPAATMIVCALIKPEMKIEIEVTAKRSI